MNEPASRYVQLLCHDMNNPLTILYGQAALLNAALSMPERDELRLRAIVAQVEEQTGRVITLVAEMRDAFRQVDGEDFDVVDLAPLLREAAAFVGRLWRYRSGRLDISVDPAVALVRVRPLQTRGAFWRLLAGAVERSPHVEVTVVRSGDQWQLTITEDGDTPIPARIGDGCVTEALERSGWTVEPWRDGGRRGWRLEHEAVDRTSAG